MSDSRSVNNDAATMQEHGGGFLTTPAGDRAGDALRASDTLNEESLGFDDDLFPSSPRMTNQWW
jgi:hypothetical protein